MLGFYKPEESEIYQNRYKRDFINLDVIDWIIYKQQLINYINSDLKAMPDPWYKNEINGVKLIITEKLEECKN